VRSNCWPLPPSPRPNHCRLCTLSLE
jgi:hypothetical protein